MKKIKNYRKKTDKTIPDYLKKAKDSKSKDSKFILYGYLRKLKTKKRSFRKKQKQ